ncbi:MAG: DUF938 domain-containing protein [Aestuariivirgaceae bacterium]
MDTGAGHRRDASAFHRNKDATLDVLKKNIKTLRPRILEIASGSGQHASFIAGAWPEVTWSPSDIDPHNIASIDAWTAHSTLDNVKPAQVIDVTSPDWLNSETFDSWAQTYDAIFCANMIHIAPWEAATGLIEGAAKRLTEGGLLLLYGPFTVNDAHTAPSNQTFDDSLRDRNPDWGIRDISAIQQTAQAHGLELSGITQMPANNMTLILRRF